MSGKEFAMSFLIGAKLQGNFNGVFGQVFEKFSSAAKNTTNYTNQIKALNKAFSEGVINQKNFQNALGQMKPLAGMAGSITAVKVSSAAFGKSLDMAKKFAGPMMAATNVAANFEAAMSKVGAIANANDEDMKKLTQTARELGEKTQYTATQSAEAMSYLGMAGWKTNEIIAGMPGMLNLAAAGGTDLARTADIVSDNLTAFNLAADKSTHMANVYATVITNTNTNVEMLGETMKYAAPVAAAFGVSMEETAALTGLMANSGIKASQAGTSLRSGFLRLAGPPKMAQKAMDELGISLNDITAEQKEATLAMESLGIKMSDYQGPHKMARILTELRGKINGLSQEEQLASMKAIFGTEGATGWLAVLKSGQGEFEKLVDSLEKADAVSDGKGGTKGAAELMAARMQDNAAGATIRYKSAVESLQISMGNAFLPTLTAVAEAGTKVANFFTQHEWLRDLAIGFTVGCVALSGFVMVVSGAMAVFKAYKSAVLLYSVVSAAFKSITVLSTAAQLALNGALLACPVTWLLAGIAALVAAGYLLYTNWNTVKQFFVNLWESPTAKTLMFIAGPLGWVTAAATVLIANWDTVKQWFITLWDNPSLAIQQFVDGLKNKFSDALAWVREKWQAISDFISTPIFGKVNIAAQGSGDGVAHNASGGIYGKGAFLTTFAENSGESAIPHTPNAHNIGLLAETNRIMGNPLGGSINATFAPNITVNGGNADQVQQVLENEMAKFKQMLADLQNQQRRLSYA